MLGVGNVVIPVANANARRASDQQNHLRIQAVDIHF